MSIKDRKYDLMAKATCKGLRAVQGAGAAGGTAMLAMMAAPMSALAKDNTGSFKSTIDSAMDKFAGAMSNVGYAILTVVASIAFVVLVVCVLKAMAGHDRQELHDQIKVCVIILVCCLLAALSPQIIKGVAGLVQGGAEMLGAGNIGKGK